MDFQAHESQKPRELDLSRIWPKLRSLGIRGVVILGFSPESGPFLKAYSSDGRSRLLKRMLKNPTVAVELSLIGKYLKEFKTHNDEKNVIRPYNQEKNEFILFQLSGRKKTKARSLLKKVSDAIEEGTNQEIKEKLDKILRTFS